MREVLFRGKRLDNGEWVEGFVRQYSIGTVTIFDKDAVCVSNVVPASVGQYTGLKDISGKSIFEGDVFKDDDNECVGVVRWHNGAFKLFWYGHDGVMMPYGYDECAGKFGVVEVETFDDVYIDQMEVIGNIHDNPEFFMEA